MFANSNDANSNRKKISPRKFASYKHPHTKAASHPLPLYDHYATQHFRCGLYSQWVRGDIAAQRPYTHHVHVTLNLLNNRYIWIEHALHLGFFLWKMPTTFARNIKKSGEQYCILLIKSWGYNVDWCNKFIALYRVMILTGCTQILCFNLQCNNAKLN